MTNNRTFLLSIALLLSCITSSLYAKDPFLNTWGDEYSINQERNKKYLADKNWDALEKVLGEAREKKTVTSHGAPVLHNMYSHIVVKSLFTSKDPDEKWLEYLKKIEQWEKAYPKSISAKTLKLRFWTSYAWKARGGGYAHTVTEEGWKGFADRLNKAEEVYNATISLYPAGKVPCPEFYNVSITLALGKGWANEDVYNDMVEPVIKLWPEYYPVHSSYAYRLEPKWMGNPGDDYRYYDSLKEAIGGEVGKKVSAYCILVYKGKSINQYRYDLVNWEDIKAGMLRYLKDHSESCEMLKRFVVFGIRYEPMDKLAKQVQAAVPKSFEKFKQLDPYGKIVSETLKGTDRSVALDYYNRPKSNPYIKDMVYATSHRNVEYFACGQLSAGLCVFDSQDGSILAQHIYKDKEGEAYWNTNGVGMSPSGKYIFAQTTKGKLNFMHVYEYSDKQLTLRKTESVPFKHVFKSIFIGDEGELIIAGYHYVTPSKKKKKKKAKGDKTQKSKPIPTIVLYAWNWKAEKSRVRAISKPPQKIPSEWVNRAGLVDIEGRGKAFGSTGDSMFVYDYKTKKIQPIVLNEKGENVTQNGMFFSKELNAIVLLQNKESSITLVDADTLKVKFRQKDLNFVANATGITGIKTDAADFTFLLSGEHGYISTYHYIGGETPEITYESTWVNNDFSASYIGLAKHKDGGVRVVQAYKGGMVGSYSPPKFR